LVERANHLAAGEAEPGLVDQEATQPIGVEAVGGLRHHGDPGEIGEGAPVSERDGATLTDALLQPPQLPPPYAGEDVAHAVVVAELGVLVGEPRIARLLRPETRLLGPIAPRRHQHAAA
jgi:hypothetical protein